MIPTDAPKFETKTLVLNRKLNKQSQAMPL